MTEGCNEKDWREHLLVRSGMARIPPDCEELLGFFRKLIGRAAEVHSSFPELVRWVEIESPLSPHTHWGGKKFGLRRGGRNLRQNRKGVRGKRIKDWIVFS